MTVQVISREAYSQIRHVRCHHCKATLVYSFEDLTRSESSEQTDYGYIHIREEYIICPDCNQKVDVR